MQTDLTRPIIGIENRTAQEVFDIMCDRIRSRLSASIPAEIGGLVERLEKRASSMNGSLVGASDGSTYAMGHYDQFASKDDRAAASALRSLSAELETVKGDLDAYKTEYEDACVDGMKQAARAEAAEAKLAGGEVTEAALMSAARTMWPDIDTVGYDEQCEKLSQMRAALEAALREDAS